MNNLQKYYKKLLQDKSTLNWLDKITCSLLTLVTGLYNIILKSREFFFEVGFFKNTKLDIPVISIGNITTGGTGKTGFCIILAGILQKKNYNIAILSRGYKGSKEHSFGIVSDGEKILLNVKESGDEPYLLATKLPKIKILVGKNRANTGLLATQKFNTNLLILDDGFQQKKLFCNIHILLLNAQNPFGNFKLLPRGILREPLKSLKKCNIIVLTNINLVNDYSDIISKIRKFNQAAKIFTAQYKPINIKDLKGNIIDKKEIENKAILAVSGIAYPEYFIKTLENWINQKIEYLYFPDHYGYIEKDFFEIETQAKNLKKDIILITEKDAVKFSNLNLPIYVVEVEMVINEKEKFEECLNEFIRLC